MGAGALHLGRLLELRAQRLGIAAAICPAAPDLGRLSAELSIPVLAQHTDPEGPGAQTGRVIAAAVKASGAVGSLVNHSEHPLSERSAAQVVGRLRSAGLTSVVCAGTIDSARRLAGLRPPYLAIEPPELIGGEIAVSQARPGLIRDSVGAVAAVSPVTRLLCGAGIHDRRDVRAALELGAEGILVASAVARAPDPGHAIDELLEGFRAGPRTSP